MIEVGKLYSKPEMTAMLGTKAKQGIDRKLERYGVLFDTKGKGEKATYKITAISDPFKVYAIIRLKFDGNTDFHKLREFYYYFFNDEEFSAMPDEVKETRMRADGKEISRQTIAGYLQKLDKQEIILRNTYNYIYYFAKTHRLLWKEPFIVKRGKNTGSILRTDWTIGTEFQI